MYNQFKIRASAASQIMGVKGLGKTGETYCKNWLMSKIFNRDNEIKSKYLEKGNVCENDSILFLNNFLNDNFSKNEKHFENDFMKGTPDLITEIDVIDMKNSWSVFTFPFFDTEINKDYETQLQVYMCLTGLKKARLIYTLMDTPEALIEKEAFYYRKSLGFDELDVETFELFKSKMTYSDIPNEKRIKIFDVDYDPNFINKLETRVIECRNYIKTLL